MNPSEKETGIVDVGAAMAGRDPHKLTRTVLQVQEEAFADSDDGSAAVAAPPAATILPEVLPTDLAETFRLLNAAQKAVDEADQRLSGMGRAWTPADKYQLALAAKQSAHADFKRIGAHWFKIQQGPVPPPNATIDGLINATQPQAALKAQSNREARIEELAAKNPTVKNLVAAHRGQK